MDADQIAVLLAHKAEIDRRQAETMIVGSYERWIADALEALLKTITVKAQEAKTPLPAQRR